MRFKVLAAFAASFLTVGSVALISGSPAAAQGETKVRLAHFSPDAPAVDIYIDGKKKLTNVPFQAVSDYTSLSAGRHVFELRASGTAETSTAALTVSQDFVAGKNYTVAAVDQLATIKGQVYTDDISAPEAGKAKIRVVHAAVGSPDIDVAAKGQTPFIQALSFSNASEYISLPAGPYELEVRVSGTKDVLLSKPVTLQGGGVYSIAAVGGSGQAPTLRGFIDLQATDTAGGGATATTVAGGSEAQATTAPAGTQAPQATAAPTPQATAAPVVTQAPVPTTKAPSVPIGGDNSGGSNSGGSNSGGSNSGGSNSGGSSSGGSSSGGSSTGGATNGGESPAGGVATGVGDIAGGGLVPFAAIGLLIVGAVVAGRSRRGANR